VVIFLQAGIVFFINLQTVIKFLDYNQPLSRPGCWAYPDMLEVGNLPTYNQNRAHFGAWVIVSAPLILGLDLTDTAKVTTIWDIISNQEALAVSQSWYGHPGMLVENITPAPPNSTTLYMWAVDCSSSDGGQYGFSYDSSTQAVKVPGGGCLSTKTPSELTSAPCDGTAAQQFTYAGASTLKASNGQCVDVYDFSGPVLELYACNGGCNQQFSFNADGTFSDFCNPKMCISARKNSPTAGNQIQVWAKPQAAGAVAVFVINGYQGDPQTIPINIANLNITTSSITVRDIWNHKDLGTASGNFTTDPIDAYDSRFYLFTPK